MTNLKYLLILPFAWLLIGGQAAAQTAAKNDEPMNDAKNSIDAAANALAADKAARDGFDWKTFDRTFTHHTATVGGTANPVKLHYVTGGTGEAVVLIHGYPATWYDYRFVMPLLAKNHTVIAVDLRGMGDSSKTLTGYDPRTMSADINEIVKKHGFAAAHVVGHDIGAPVAYMYAVQFPSEVKKLVELEFVAGAALEELIEKAQPNLWFFAFQAFPDLPEKLTEGRERIYLSAFLNPFTYGGNTITADAVDEYVRAYSAPGGMRAGFEYYRNVPAFTKFMKETAPAKLKMPVLALTGEASMGNPALGQPAEKFIRQVADNARYEVVPFSGHWIAEERPAYLAEKLLAFFGENK